MKYNIDSLGSANFEEMIQSLLQREIGLDGTIFGQGKDGGREYIFEGEAKLEYPNKEINWDGYWVIQAKFKSPETRKPDYEWVKEQFEGEMKKFKDSKRNLKKPDNYLFVTNVRLTGQAETGEIDKFNKIVANYRNYIPNIGHLLYDDICSLLENNRDVAISYASFILPGDILARLYDHINEKSIDVKKILLRFLSSEFKEDIASKLEQSGRKADDMINIEEVFYDLNVTNSNIIDSGIIDEQISGLSSIDGISMQNNKKRERFINKFITLSDKCQKKSNYCEDESIKRLNKYVIIGSAGQGKSTLTQFLSQLYRAYFINSESTNTPNSISSFLINLSKRKQPIKKPEIFRFPIRIILPDYSAWIINQQKNNNPINIISFIKSLIEQGGDTIKNDHIRQLLKNISVIIIFDGLDEVPSSSNRNTIVKEIDKFVEFELHEQNSDSIILITTRPQGFKDEFNNQKFTHLRIVEFAQQDCLAYLDSLLDKTVTKKNKEKQFNILKKAVQNESSGRLMRTPLDATIMATLVKRGGNPPEVKYNLYKEYYKTIFDREKEKEVFELDKHTDAINYLHEYLGFTLQRNAELNNGRSKIDRKKFKEIINNYYVKQGFIQNEVIERVEEISKILTNRLVMLSELTVDLDDPNNNIIGFPVAPIQEYFASLFLINSEEAIVIERVKKIVDKSYWRNVLLFIIGYFQNERRKHLVENIYTTCEESNFNISKVGAWLSIDILIDNIFSEIPIKERLFAKQLKLILELAVCEEQNYLLRLPERIISKYLTEYFEEILSSSKKIELKLSVWNIISQLPTIFNKQIIKHWPEDDNQYKLLKFLLEKERINYKFFKEKIEKLFHELINDKDISIIKLLNIIKDNSNFLKTNKKVIIEKIFFSPQQIDNKVQLIIDIEKNNLENLDSYDSYRSNTKPYSTIEINISKNYKRKIYAGRQNILIIQELLETFKRNNIYYLEKLYLFYLNPSEEKLNDYIIEIYKNKNIDLSLLKKQHKSWLLLYFFNGINKIDELKEAIIKRVKASNIFNEYKAIEKEIFSNGLNTSETNQDIILKYSVEQTTGKFIEKYNVFYLKLISSEKINIYPSLRKEVIIGFISMFLGKRRLNYKEDKESLDYNSIVSIVDFIQKNHNDIINLNTNFNITFLLLSSILSFLSDSDVIKLLEKKDDVLFTNLNIKTYYNSFLFKELNLHDDVVKWLNHNISSKSDGRIIKYALQLFYHDFETPKLLDINYKELREKNYSDLYIEISRLILVLYIEIAKEESELSTFDEILRFYPAEKDIMEYLVQAIKNGNNKFSFYQEYIEQIYKLIKQEDPVNYTLLSSLETLEKNKIESMPSDYNNEDVIKKLKLSI